MENHLKTEQAEIRMRLPLINNSEMSRIKISLVLKATHRIPGKVKSGFIWSVIKRAYFEINCKN